MEIKLDFIFFISLLQNLLGEMHEAAYLSVCENWQGKQANQLQPCLLQSDSPENCTRFSTLFLLKISTHITQTICNELVTALGEHQPTQFRQVYLSALFFKSVQ